MAQPVLAREPHASSAGDMQGFNSGNGLRSVRALSAVATSQRTAKAGCFSLQEKAGRMGVEVNMLGEI